MIGSLDIAVAQPLTVAHDVVGNAQRHADAIRAARARVVIFPEMSLTGYEFDAAPLGASDQRLATIVDACIEMGTFALAGAPVADPGDGSNIGMLSFDAGRVEIAYRKMWLGDAEADHFVPGRQPAVVVVDGWRLGLAICKDTGISEHAAATAAVGVDVYVAGVLEHDCDQDVQPVRAERIATQHGVSVAIASFAGSTGEGFDVATGRSAIWRPDGTIAAEAGSQPGDLVVATLERPRPISGRGGFPPDRDV